MSGTGRLNRDGRFPFFAVGGRFAVVRHLFSLQPGAPRFLSRQQRVLWDNNLLEQEGKPLLAGGFPS
ncbi:hypothetical protein C5O12_11550 [Akkermansia muciniphila]|nr:hypothetical protein CXT98_07040 [Akkermansia muciniphila]QAA39882.1 hypothetical protein C1I90_11960 [Akkermansia muciniphila]QAA63043.1 hypothetical protein C1O59_11535 [Akkermansia muciniphila]QHV22214.1 hypothetical protein C5O12_11550 [Akkermansia muciniphila]QHV24432.1 hypothetical protein C5O13_11460 [Akkermansia muciniphila]